MVECLNDYTDDYFNGQDHLYSTVALYEIDSDSGNFSLAERYEYDAYGEARVMDSAYVLQSTSVAENPYTFTGRRQDTLDDGGYSVMYYRARYYDTDTGRFMQRDPLGYVDGMSLYEYVTSNPINYSDAYGLFKCTDKCKAGDIDYDWDSVVVPNGYPPDIYQKPGQFEDLLGAVGFADLISQIGLPLDMIVEQLIGIGDPTMPLYLIS